MSKTRYPLLRLKLHPLLIQGEATLQQAMNLTRRCAPGETLISAGAMGNAVHLLVSGWVMRTRLADDVGRQIISIFLPGDLIGVYSILLELQPDTVVCL